MADVDGDAGVLAQALLDALVRDPHDRVLARLDRLHVDPDRPFDHDAEVGGAARDVGRAGARDQRLGRDAAVVDAGAAEALALDDRRPVWPASARRRASDGPDWPVPMTMASKLTVMSISARCG